LLGIVLDLFWNFLGIFWNFFGIFWRIFLEEYFWEKFFGRNFLGEIFGRIFWGGFFGRNFLHCESQLSYLNMEGIDLFVTILVFVKILSK
jgi:hypothetical protein